MGIVIPQSDFDRREEARREEVRTLKAAATDKEPFDYARFVHYYAHDTGSFLPLTGNEPEYTKLDYEWEYYRSPEVNSVEGYARMLNRLEEAV